MTPLPKRKHSRARKGRRRAAINLGLPTLVRCSNCLSFKKPHSVCGSCGYYQGREVVSPKVKSKKNEKPA